MRSNFSMSLGFVSFDDNLYELLAPGLSVPGTTFVDALHIIAFSALPCPSSMLK